MDGFWAKTSDHEAYKIETRKKNRGSSVWLTRLAPPLPVANSCLSQRQSFHAEKC
jgi:hypothetical protein